MTTATLADVIPAARYRPVDLPRHRAAVLDDLARLSPQVFAQHFANGTQKIIPPSVALAITSGRPPRTSQVAGNMMALEEHTRIADADLFYVAPEMTMLAMTAGQALPEYEFRADQLPAPTGWMLFDGPVVETYDEPWGELADNVDVPAPLVAVAWSVVNYPVGDGFRRGVWFSYYADRDIGDTYAVDRGVLDRRLLADMIRAGRAAFTYDNESMIFEGTKWSTIADPSDTDLAIPAAEAGKPVVGVVMTRTLLAASLLMQQPLAEVVDARDTYTRHERKQAARAGHADTAVRLVHLRERPRREPTGEHRDVEWSRRWLVRGFWRMQPYGPRQAYRRPQYVPPFLKGPEDKPLVLRDTVKVWDR